MSTIKHVFFVGRTACLLMQPGFPKKYDVSANTTCLQLSSVEYTFFNERDIERRHRFYTGNTATEENGHAIAIKKFLATQL